MPEGKQVNVSKAKGRPMLTWVGKRPLRHVTAFPAQLVETFSADGPEHAEWSDWPKDYPQGGLLFHGDNKEVLAHLLANGFRGKVKLIYIDPPFDSGADYVRKVSLRGVSGTVALDGEAYTLGEQIQYTDIWANDNYLQFMYERFMLLKELLTKDGTIFVHCDWHKNHHLRLLLDEVFGSDSVVNEIIWWYYDKMPTGGTALDRQHDTVIQYRKGSEFTANPVRELRENPGRKREVRRKVDGQMLRVRDESGRQVYAQDDPFKRASDVWKLALENSMASGRTGYPTQKPLALLQRIVEAASDVGDVVLDCFAGTGTTLAAAQKLGRRWIGCDINKGAIQTMSKRLLDVMNDQATTAGQNDAQTALPMDDTTQEPTEQKPAQLSFAVYRVNDYDLQIQHNEAVGLACEHIGVTRNRADSYFDGTLANKLVKVIPFNHPLTPLDLEEIKTELSARPEEDRDIVVVSLGKELASDAWLDEWNRLRKKGDVPNGIEVIELHTDPKYGKFFQHTPAEARVYVKREGEKVIVEVKDFISPTILERLRQQAGILQPQIDDWRAMVDTVMVDASYDGMTFNIEESDVPEKKTDLVSGRYELPAPSGPTTVAVKITDMLGEEVLVTAEV